MNYEQFPYELGAYDVVNLLYELHQRGYQQLRLHSMMAPNGCAMRTSITTKRYMMPSGLHVENFDSPMFWAHSSAYNTLYKGDYNKLADEFIRAFPDLCESGYGSDPGYSMWLRNLMPLMYESWYPDMEEAYFRERRCFMHGDDCIPFPPL